MTLPWRCWISSLFRRRDGQGDDTFIFMAPTPYIQCQTNSYHSSRTRVVLTRCVLFFTACLLINRRHHAWRAASLLSIPCPRPRPSASRAAASIARPRSWRMTGGWATATTAAACAAGGGGAWRGAVWTPPAPTSGCRTSPARPCSHRSAHPREASVCCRRCLQEGSFRDKDLVTVMVMDHPFFPQPKRRGGSKDSKGIVIEASVFCPLCIASGGEKGRRMLAAFWPPDFGWRGMHCK